MEKNVFQQLNYLLDRKKKWGLVVMILMAIIGSAAELMGVTIILPIVELAMDQGDVKNNKFSRIIHSITGAETKEEILLWMIGITIAIYIIKNIYICIMYSKQYQYAATIKKDTATRLMKSYLSQPYSFFLYKNTSELIRSVNTDTGELFTLISNLLMIFSSSLMSLCIIVFLASTNLAMTLTISAILMVCLLTIVLTLQKSNRENGKISIRLNGFLIKHLQQAFEGVKEIKIMNTEQYFTGIYERTYKDSTEIDVRYSIRNTMPKYIIEVFSVVAVLGFLAFNIAFNPQYITLIPQLATFCVAAFKLLPGINSIYSAYNKVVYRKACIDIVYNDIMVSENYVGQLDESTDNNTIIPFNDKIELKDLSFIYEGATDKILDHVSLEIKKGQSIALIGSSGGGKTTTADLILSLLKPTDGVILSDGVDIRKNPRNWRGKFGYIPQTIYLIDDSIKKNIAFGIPEAEIDEKRIWGVLKEAQLKEFVESLPMGLDTEVGERGARISGGQRQRIGIARALYRNPEILVFDEATSALDNKTEKEVMQAIEGLQGKKTILMIAHRLSTIEACDAVYKVENGKIEKVR
ncbi:MAG: ABC transporter ATP-binding protein/permease [Lachnospiraceae bacterium]|nr:ABC transporter ATP-binding protein/permease [Lachnospiraceae bacterium]